MLIKPWFLYSSAGCHCTIPNTRKHVNTSTTHTHSKREKDRERWSNTLKCVTVITSSIIARDREKASKMVRLSAQRIWIKCPNKTYSNALSLSLVKFCFWILLEGICTQTWLAFYDLQTHTSKHGACDPSNFFHRFIVFVCVHVLQSSYELEYSFGAVVDCVLSLCIFSPIINRRSEQIHSFIHFVTWSH